jgi:osmotically-inducible protein OsmY
MKREHDLKQHLAMAVIIGVVLMLTGCDKQTQSGETVGQKVDKAIDKTNATMEQAGDKIGETARMTEDAVKSGAETVQQKAASVGTAIDDSVITASIKADLLKDPGLSALRIDVDTVKGEVTLKGEADSAAARERAERIASANAGVVKVNNSISIKN